MPLVLFALADLAITATTATPQTHDIARRFIPTHSLVQLITTMVAHNPNQNQIIFSTDREDAKGVGKTQSSPKGHTDATNRRTTVKG